MSDNSATKFDKGKERTDLLSPIAMMATSVVLADGAVVHGDHNWRKGLSWSRLIASTLRHFFKFMRGEDLDKDSGHPHIDHVATNVMFLQEYFYTRRDLDDRYKVFTLNVVAIPLELKKE